MGYTIPSFEVYRTEEFSGWLESLRDRRVKGRIATRINRVQLGNLGDVRSVGGGISEMRIDAGAGYRVYFALRERIIIILLCGGDKSNQARDIARVPDIALRYV